ncbi:MAG: caspase family protein [Planctomycetaceae bacterium]|jgi:hypothetical protein|nr:caspase family protein [Planctomycetaceae bacterium]
MSKFISFTSAVLFCLAAFVQAESLQEVAKGVSGESSRGITIEKIQNDNARFSVGITLNHENNIYTEDELLTASVKSSEDGYLYLLHIGADNTKTMLIPNKFQADNEIKSGTAVGFPSSDSDFRFRVTPPFGTEKIIAFVTKKPLKSVNVKNFTESSVTAIESDSIEELESELKAAAKNVAVEGTGSTGNNFARAFVAYTSRSKNSVAPAQQEQRYAACFGVSQYKCGEVLAGCDKDAYAVAKLLNEKCGVPKNNIAVFTDKMVTVQSVKNLFCEVLPKILKPNDVLFIYWSGHGGQLASQKTGRDFDQYLIPYEYDVADKENTLIFEDPLGIWLQNLSGRKILFILDACHSGGILTNARNVKDAKEFGGEKSFAELTGGNPLQGSVEKGKQDWKPLTFAFKPFARSKSVGQKNLAAIASSTDSQLSFVRDDGELSVMTYFLIEAVKDGSVAMTHKDIASAIKSKVNNYVRTHHNGTNQEVVEQDDLNPALKLKP